MTVDARALCTVMCLHDSAFPAGRLVHSNGFEEWLARRPDADHAAVATAALDWLRHSCGTLDATVTALAWRAAPSLSALTELDDVVSSHKLSRHARVASTSAGHQLAATAHEVGLVGAEAYLAAVLDGDTAGHLAVVDGALHARCGIDLHTTVLASVRSTLTAMLSAAVRLGRLGPLAAQCVQIDHVGTLIEVARQAGARTVDALSSTAVAFDIAGMQHETRTQRLFAS